MSILIGSINLRLIDLLRHTNILNQLQILRIEQYKDSSTLDECSKNKYINHLNYAKEHTIYYKSLFRSSSVNILTKDLIRQNKSSLLSDNYAGKLFEKATGGSTGNPLVYYTTNEAQSFMWAAILLSWESAGYKLGDKVAFISGTSLWKNDFKHRIFYKLLNISVFSAYDLDDEHIINYLRDISYRKFRLIYAYASVLDRISEFIINTKFKFSHSLKAIVSSAEILTPLVRSKIEFAFKVRVFNQYGCNEAAISAFECQHGSLHLINTASSVFTDNEGNLFATNLINKGFPIIHYQTGDKVLFSPDVNCNCGRGYPVIKEVIGRSFDFIKDIDGKSLNASFFSILFRSNPAIEKYQVIYDDKSITIILKLNTDQYHSSNYQPYVDKLKDYLKFEQYELLINSPFFTVPNGKHIQIVDLLKYNYESLV